jgi:hypothetical protein
VRRGIARMLSSVPRIHLLSILRQVAPEATAHPLGTPNGIPNGTERFRRS